MRRLFSLVLLLVIVLPTLGCAAGGDNTPIPLEPARELSSRVASDFISGRVDDLYPLIHPASQKLMDREAAARLLKQMEEYSGKPLEAKLKSKAYGRYVAGTWGNRPYWTFWYELRTTKAEPGKYYLIVEIVSDGGQLSCSSFRDVSFTNKPGHLR